MTHRFPLPRARWIPGLLAIGMLTACSPKESPSYVYTCSETLRFTARFEPERAVLSFPDRELRLPQVVSGSGARYSDGKTTFWIKGDSASLEIDGKTYPDCRSEANSTPE